MENGPARTDGRWRRFVHAARAAWREMVTPGAAPLAGRWGLAWLPLLALVLGGLFAASPLALPIAHALQDQQLKLAARTTHYPEVLIVDIDEASVRALQPRLGSWPYSRDTYALAIGYLRELGARVVVLDIVLNEPRNGDAALARVLAQRRDVVLAAAGQNHVDEDAPRLDALHARLAMPVDAAGLAARWESLALPTSTLLGDQAAASLVPGRLGVVSTGFDRDGVVRRLPLLHGVGTGVYPSLALAPLLLASDAAPQDWRWDGDVLQVGARRWPIDDGGRMTLSVPQNDDAISSLPFNAVMAAALGVSEGAGLLQAVQGRTVFIGSTLLAADVAWTPFAQLSGVRLMATAYAALQRGEVIDTRNPVLEAALGLCGLAPMLWLWLRRRPALLHDVAAALLAAAGVVAASQLALVFAGRLASPLPALAVIAAGLLLAVPMQLRWAAMANRRLRLERAVAEAENEAKSDFLANVSHEIRTPMNALLGVAELLQRTPLNIEQQRYVEVFRRSGQHLQDLINDLLDLSKIEAGRMLLDPRPFVLRALLDEQRALLSVKASGKGLALEWQVSPRLPAVVLGDRLRLAQVLTNLIGNAIKFTPAGRVEVEVAPFAADGEAPGSGAEVLFSVRDTGIGIDPSEHERIFQPFTQADGGPTRVHGGTGLGLAIARRLVGQMGGRIEVLSALGEGAQFRFAIPLPAAELPARPPAPADEAPAAGASHPVARRLDGRLRVLLTEDNDINVMVVEAMLAGQDIDLDVAANGEEALAKFRRGGHGLVLMDIQMPGIDGHETTREIRRIEAAEGRRPVPVIALTAHAFERDAQASLEAGCNAHLTKPIRREDLLATIRAFCTDDRDAA